MHDDAWLAARRTIAFACRGAEEEDNDGEEDKNNRALSRGFVLSSIRPATPLGRFGPRVHGGNRRGITRDAARRRRVVYDVIVIRQRTTKTTTRARARPRSARGEYRKLFRRSNRFPPCLVDNIHTYNRYTSSRHEACKTQNINWAIL